MIVMMSSASSTKAERWRWHFGERMISRGITCIRALVAVAWLVLAWGSTSWGCDHSGVRTVLQCNKHQNACYTEDEVAPDASSSTDAESGCFIGQVATCSCESGYSGLAYCNENGQFDECICDSGWSVDGGMHVDAGLSDTECLVPRPESCDGMDNDCNGVVDDGDVCPLNLAVNADVFGGGVYLRGNTVAGACGSDAIMRFWPAMAGGYLSGFDCNRGFFAFNYVDMGLFYSGVGGVYRDRAVSDELVPTPPCGRSVGTEFGFDGFGDLYYRCQGTVYRGGKQLVLSGVDFIVAVLADGRVVVQKHASAGFYYSLYGRDGRELSRLEPVSVIGGTAESLRVAASSFANRAYVASKKRLQDGSWMIYLFKVDERNRWIQIRRLPLAELGGSQLVLPNGTFLVRKLNSALPSNELIVAHLPDGSTEVVWDERTSLDVKSPGTQMLLGPP